MIPEVHSRSAMAAAGSFGLAVLATLVWLFLPALTTGTTVWSTDGRSHSAVVRQTLVEAVGWQVVRFLAVPVVVAGLGLAIRRRWALIPAAAVLWLFVLVTGFSIGLFYLPAAVAMAAAAAISAAETPAT
jgi:hypothetical protein